MNTSGPYPKAADDALKQLLRPMVEEMVTHFLDLGLHPPEYDGEMEEYANRLALDRHLGNTEAVERYERYVEQKNLGLRSGDVPSGEQRERLFRWYVDLNLAKFVSAWTNMFFDYAQKRVRMPDDLGDDMLPKTILDDELSRRLEGQSSYLAPHWVRETLRRLHATLGGKPIPDELRAILAWYYAEYRT